MSFPSVFGRAQQRVRTMMTTAVVVYATSVTVDPATLDATETRVVHYTGVSRIRFSSSAVADRNAASQDFAARQGVLDIPADLTHTIVTDDKFEALGQTFRITGATPESFRTKTRFAIELLS